MHTSYVLFADDRSTPDLSTHWMSLTPPAWQRRPPRSVTLAEATVILVDVIMVETYLNVNLVELARRDGINMDLGLKGRVAVVTVGL